MNIFVRRKVILDRYGIIDKLDDCSIIYVFMNSFRKFYVFRVDNEIFF